MTDKLRRNQFTLLWGKNMFANVLTLACELKFISPRHKSDMKYPANILLTILRMNGLRKNKLMLKKYT